MLNEVRIIVTEADAGFRQGLTQLLGQQDAFEIVDDLDTGRDTVVAVRELEPDLLLLDMELKDMPGLDVLRQIGGVGSLHTVAMVDKLSVHEMTQALLLGACGAVEKSAKSPALLKCIRAVLAGDLWFQRDVTKALLNHVESGKQEPRYSSEGLVGRLTNREGDVLRAVASGMPNREIATKLRISEYTVKHHLSRIFAKLSVSNRVELALLAAKYDL